MNDQLHKPAPPYIDIGEGHRLFVRDWGGGPPVIMMAGWGMDSRLWGEVMLALNAAGLRTIAYDRRSHGQSTDVGPMDYDTLADDLSRLLETLDLRDATLVCHSGAGGEAIRYVTRHGPDRLARIVLAGATGPIPLPLHDPDGRARAAAEAMIDRIAFDLPAWLAESLKPFAPQADDRLLEWAAQMVLDTPRRALVDFQRAIVNADLTEEAANLSLPVTIIHGDQDVSAPFAATANCYAELIEQADLILYEGAAHGLMLTHAARLAADIAASVKR